MNTTGNAQHMARRPWLAAMVGGIALAAAGASGWLVAASPAVAQVPGGSAVAGDVRGGKGTDAGPKTKAANATSASAKAGAKAVEISWDDLIPKDWDPSVEFADLIAQGAEAWEDTDPRAQELYARLRKVWDNAPVVSAMNGRNVRLPGYVVALEETREGLTEMLLVPNFGACIHTPPPPANQIIHVRLPKPAKGYESLDAVWISGKLEVKRGDSEMGVSGYAMVVDQIEKYRE